MSQGITIQGKTSGDENVPVRIDSEGALVISGSFPSDSDVTTVINGNIITQTDGVSTLTITISGNTITEVWS